MPTVGGRNPQSLLRGDRFEIGVKQTKHAKEKSKKIFLQNMQNL
jgi:hypothetical protein